MLNRNTQPLTGNLRPNLDNILRCRPNPLLPHQNRLPQKLVPVPRIVPPRPRGIQSIGTLSLQRVQSVPRFVEHYRGTLDLRVIGRQESSHTEGAPEFGVESILLLST